MTESKVKLILTPIGKTAIHVPTQEEYWTLMRVYEIGKWKWRDGKKPTSVNIWTGDEKETCISAVDYNLNGTIHKNSFGFSDRRCYSYIKWNIITPQDFYNFQNPRITLENIREINELFKGR